MFRCCLSHSDSTLKNPNISDFSFAFHHFSFTRSKEKRHTNMKRSRINRSTIFGDIRVLNLPPAAASAFRWNLRVNPFIISAYAPPPNVWEMARVGILTLSAPEMAVESRQPQGQVSHFLDKCFFCKKGLRQGDETFMYGDFRAFCTPECRSKQIAVDNEKERVSKQSTGRKTQCSRKSALK